MKTVKKVMKWFEGLIRILVLSGGFHKEEQELRGRYYTSEKKIGIESLQVIVMVDGRCVHGGLSDRIRGIATIYDYCKERNIPFFLNYIYPFKLEEYLEPNLYNWRIDKDKISYHQEEALPVQLQVKLLPSKLHRLYLDRMISKYPKKQLHIYSNTLFNDERFSQNFAELFKPTSRLQESLSIHTARIGTPYVAMVFRFQQLLGDFKEDGYRILPIQDRKVLIENCIKKAEEIHSLQCPNRQLLITSDSVTFLETIEAQKEYVSIIPGEIVHMDYTSKNDYEIYMKSFLDLLMLSKAEKIYLFQTGEMYHSGFAKRAAKIRNIPYEEVIF